MFFVQVLQKRFHLNVHIIGFHTQNQKVKITLYSIINILQEIAKTNHKLTA